MSGCAALSGMGATVRKGRYDIVTAAEPLPGAFATVCAGGDPTCVVADGSYTPEAVSHRDVGWRIISIDAVLPLDLTGVLATLSGWLSHEGIPLFCLSSFETDHLLVREQDTAAACASLTRHGMAVRDEEGAPLRF